MMYLADVRTWMAIPVNKINIRHKMDYKYVLET